jgi:hypothetical protein
MLEKFHLTLRRRESAVSKGEVKSEARETKP